MNTTMRIAYLIAGAGGMYCGSCLRDNRLAAAWKKQGRDVLLIPLYTPIRTDEADVSEGVVYYGGLNVYLQHLGRWFGGVPRFLNRWLDSPLVLRAVGHFAASTQPKNLGALTVDVLRGANGPMRRESDKLAAALQALQPDVIHLPTLLLIGLARPLREALASHPMNRTDRGRNDSLARREPARASEREAGRSDHSPARTTERGLNRIAKEPSILCNLSGEDIFLDALREPFRSQAFELIRASVLDVDGYVAPSKYYASRATDHFNLPSERVHFAPMGIDVDVYRPAFDVAISRDHAPTIGYFARVCPEKGLHVLVDAFLSLRATCFRCRLKVAGYVGSADRKYWREMHRRLCEAVRAGAAELIGEVSREEKIRFLHSIDVLCVPAVYREAKGLYVLEAMASGVPVVLPNHGAFPELVETTGGGLLYDPSNSQDLITCLRRVLEDASLRKRLSEAAVRGVRDHYASEQMADRTWEIYERHAHA